MTPRFENGRDGGDKSRGDELARQVAELQQQLQEHKVELHKAQSDAQTYEKALSSCKTELDQVGHELFSHSPVHTYTSRETCVQERSS